MATYAIKQLIDKIGLGEIRIPAFQRGFVWTPEKVSFLMDSIYRGYPIGSLLLWKTQDRLNSEKDVGPYKLPEPREKYPISYVLDGQQRLTSFFATFQTDLQPDPDAEIDWLDVYFDLMAQEDSESLFVSLPEEEVDPARYFPLASIYDVGGYRSATRGLNDQMQEKCEALRLRFIQAQILAEEIDNPDREQVAIIFERVNRAGVPLDTFQLLAAWTWSTEFDLREQFQDLSDEVEDFGFGDIRDEPNLLLKCCSAVVAGEATPKAIIRLRGPDVRRDFPAIKSGVLGTIDFLRRELNILSLRMMPYPAMMVPLAKFFATDRSSGRSLTHRQKEKIERWFWRSCFARRYSSTVDRAHGTDIPNMARLQTDETSPIDDVACVIRPEFFLENQFNLSAVNTKTHVALLAQRRPLSFISGNTLNLTEALKLCNRNEFHHIFEKRLLTGQGVDKRLQNCLANMTILSMADNQKIKGMSPGEYVAKMPDERRDDILAAHLIDPKMLEGFETFRQKRAYSLAACAAELCDIEMEEHDEAEL